MTINSSDIPAENMPAASRPRWGRVLAWGGLLVLLVILALGLFRSQQGPVSKGQVVPTFSLTTFDGETYQFEDLAGKIIVLNFWASWCKPCEQEAADLEAAWQIYKDRGDVVFLGVDYVDTETEALGYLSKFNITYPNGPDLGTRISQSFRIRGVPETYFVDREGKLAHAQIGPFSSISQIRAIVEPLLGP
jgi:cytochrome c biogenesis protein CcmG/thiol:disulfide interchange protein DsbE